MPSNHSRCGDTRIEELLKLSLISLPSLLTETIRQKSQENVVKRCQKSNQDFFILSTLPCNQYKPSGKTCRALIGYGWEWRTFPKGYTVPLA